MRHVVPDNEWALVGNVVESFAPAFKPRTGVAPYVALSEERPTRERGEYLARSAANCTGSPLPRATLTSAINRPEFSGGNEMEPTPRPDADISVWFRPEQHAGEGTRVEQVSGSRHLRRPVPARRAAARGIAGAVEMLRTYEHG